MDDSQYVKALREHEEAVTREIDRRAERMKNLLAPGKAYTVEHKFALEVALCQENIEHWLRNWAWLYEPRMDQKVIPFLFWDEVFPAKPEAKFERNLIKDIQGAIVQGHDLLIEKSRDMGVTWSVMLVYVYLWQFHGMTFLAGSRKAEEVDKLGDLDALLPKARFLLEKQPKWLLPKGFKTDVHSGWMNIQNPQSGGSIAGESNNANFGTGGRKNAAFFDEFSKWEHTDDAAWTSAGQTSSCRIAVSTPLYKNNRFFALQKEPIHRVTVHWSQHPIKSAGITKVDGRTTSWWYEEQKKRYRPDELAQELDISYAGTQQSTVFHEELASMRMDKRLAKIPYIAHLPVYWAFDPGTGAVWANGFYQIIGYAEEVRWFDYYENQNYGLDHYLQWVKDPERLWNRIWIDKPPGGENYRKGWEGFTVIPDPNIATNMEMASGRSLVSALRMGGFQKIVVKPVGRMQAISQAKWVLKKVFMDDGSNSSRMLTAFDRLQGYHYKYNANLAEFEQEPVHDINSHGVDQFKYFANFLKNPEQLAADAERGEQQMERIIKSNIKPRPIREEVGMAGI